MTSPPRDALEAHAPDLAAWLDRLAMHDHPVLLDLEREAERSRFPLVGPQVGRLLYALTLLRRPRRIFELGSGAGYSALWFALALRDAGLRGHATVTLTDADPDNIERARHNLQRADLLDLADLRCGDALDLLQRDDGPPPDLVLLDIDKERYPEALPLIADRLPPGGALLADNVLWYGRPLDPLQQDPATQGIRDFNRDLSRRSDLTTAFLSVRDGLALAIKRP